MTTENALPTTMEIVPASDQQTQADALDTTQVEGTEGDGEKAKPEKTPEQRELDRIRRGIDRKTRQLAETRAELDMLRRQGSQPHSRAVTEQDGGGTKPTADDEPIKLSRAELEKLVEQRASQLAPRKAEMERRTSVVQGLEKEWGKEKFDSMASELDDAFDGLADAATKQPKPATDAIFESDMPRELIEYLTDPENAKEAEELSRMSAVQAGRFVAKLEAKLSTKEDKPQRSNAKAPIEALKGAGKSNSMPNPSDSDAWIKWANENQRKR